MNEAGIQNLQRSMTIKYVIAVSLIAILATIAYYSVFSAMKGSDSLAYVVNISGKQRMLSQHIALDVNRFYLKKYHESGRDTENLTKVQKIFRRNAQEMTRANQILSSGRFTNRDVFPLSPVINKMYFGDLNVSKRVQEYLQLAFMAMSAENAEQSLQFVEKVNMLSEPLLFDLNKLVQQYQIEGEERLNGIKQMETALWVLTLFTLLLVALFIFKPMVRQIVTLSRSEMRSLELVNLRTLHLEQANQKLSELAQQDPLTELRNRLTMEADIENVIQQSHLNQVPFAVLMFDVDFFKSVNDEYGHAAGDQVLLALADIFKANLRAQDRAYRAGGEEFVVLLNRVTYQQAFDKAEFIHQAVESDTFEVGGVYINRTLSGGIYHSEMFDAMDATTVLKQVDEAMYRSKTNGRNQLSKAEPPPGP